MVHIVMFTELFKTVYPCPMKLIVTVSLFQVEEINQNFYTYMAIPNDASTSDVRKAYRRLSLVLHPDRNSADDADEKFRY